jgi:hypothetical protein
MRTNWHDLQIVVLESCGKPSKLTKHGLYKASEFCGFGGLLLGLRIDIIEMYSWRHWAQTNIIDMLRSWITILIKTRMDREWSHLPNHIGMGQIKNIKDRRSRIIFSYFTHLTIQFLGYSILTHTHLPEYWSQATQAGQVAQFCGSCAKAFRAAL